MLNQYIETFSLRPDALSWRDMAVYQVYLTVKQDHERAKRGKYQDNNSQD